MRRRFGEIPSELWWNQISAAAFFRRRQKPGCAPLKNTNASATAPRRGVQHAGSCPGFFKQGAQQREGNAGRPLQGRRACAGGLSYHSIVSRKAAPMMPASLPSVAATTGGSGTSLCAKA